MKGAGKKKKKGNKKKSEGGPAVNLRSRIREYQQTQQQVQKPKVGVVFDEEMLLHKSHGQYHPERPERLMAIHLSLTENGLYENLVKLECEPAEEKVLELVYSPLYI
mmetsp:Transcript_2258/g.1599  ORF Transcript_2258/g.1599 Transcript_2258/m.1599 type:complete len:107 (+) Transcript_2258:170-490(+)